MFKKGLKEEASLFKVLRTMLLSGLFHSNSFQELISYKENTLNLL
ncbi:hypothetical protein FLACOL7796_00764 [Flavobacterium collinsii]|uniref:Uncharacterized protein n=1 Tax=Flavobacterium collinsii TaxID=1114861 RepID=A0ABM8KEL1_9FLAO|nr:hypothetical protein FLACOL7796_00764 [Flavobacterium collinsii]